MTSIIEELAQYTLDPYRCVLAAFPWGEGELAGIPGPRQWQADELKAIGAHLSDPATRFTPYRSAIVSGNGPGKSALVAMITKWALSTCDDCRVMITANTGAQLNSKTQPEVAKWFRLAEDRDYWDVQATRISTIDPGHRANWRADFETWSENNPEAFAGLHNVGKRIVVIFDEASGIPRIIWDTVQGALTDANTEIIWLAFGNGTLNEGPFFECFNSKAHIWRNRHIDTRDVPGTNKAEIAKWIDEEGLDSDWVRIHVRGLFPHHSELQFIGRDVVKKAMTYVARGYEDLPKILSCDVARFGSAETVIGLRQERQYLELDRYRRQDTQFTGARLCDLIRQHKPAATVIDANGIGGAVVDYCQALGYEVYGFDSSAQAFAKHKYGNRRAEIWALGKFWLEAGASIPPDEQLAEQIAGPHFYYRTGQASHGALMIERKEDMGKRGMASPDRADALMLTFAVNPELPSTHTRTINQRDVYIPGGWQSI